MNCIEIENKPLLLLNIDNRNQIYFNNNNNNGIYCDKSWPKLQLKSNSEQFKSDNNYNNYNNNNNNCLNFNNKSKVEKTSFCDHFESSFSNNFGVNESHECLNYCYDNSQNNSQNNDNCLSQEKQFKSKIIKKLTYNSSDYQKRTETPLNSKNMIQFIDCLNNNERTNNDSNESIVRSADDQKANSDINQNQQKQEEKSFIDGNKMGNKQNSGHLNAKQTHINVKSPKFVSKFKKDKQQKCDINSTPNKHLAIDCINSNNNRKSGVNSVPYFGVGSVNSVYCDALSRLNSPSDDDMVFVDVKSIKSEDKDEENDDLLAAIAIELKKEDKESVLKVILMSFN
jgi:hypothetical protein